jgi:hypothetical protein
MQKLILAPTTLTCMCLAVFACHSDIEPEFAEKQTTTWFGAVLSPTDVARAQDALATSRALFDNRRENPYSYIESYRYAASESRSQTTIRVEGDNILSRSYLYYSDYDDSWSECAETSSEEIGKQCSGAFPALPMDELYDICATNILASELGDAESETGHSIRLGFFDNGLLAGCTAFPRNCFDDCQIGFSLTAFSDE